MLQMEDESGQDEKIICVPHDKIHPLFKTVHAIEDLPEITRQAIEHFFTRYKDLEPDKWVKVTGWADKAAAEAVITKAIAANKQPSHGAATEVGEAGPDLGKSTLSID